MHMCRGVITHVQGSSVSHCSLSLYVHVFRASSRAELVRSLASRHNGRAVIFYYIMYKCRKRGGERSAVGLFDDKKFPERKKHVKKI